MKQPFIEFFDDLKLLILVFLIRHDKGKTKTLDGLINVRRRTFVFDFGLCVQLKPYSTPCSSSRNSLCGNGIDELSPGLRPIWRKAALAQARWWQLLREVSARKNLRL